MKFDKTEAIQKQFHICSKRYGWKDLLQLFQDNPIG